MAHEDLLSPDQLRQLLGYDADTGHLTWLPRPAETFSCERSAKIWHTRFVGKPAFTSLGRNGYRTGSCFGRTYNAHRVIWAIVTGEWPKGEVDHINHDRSDNRWANLRLVDRSQNRRNHSLSPRNTSGYNGVTWHKGARKWQAQLHIGARAIDLGRFNRLEDAVAARKAADVEHGFHENHGAA